MVVSLAWPRFVISLGSQPDALSIAVPSEVVWKGRELAGRQKKVGRPHRQ
jgi:hypothetical protein